MRIRQIKPEFFSDRALAALDDSTRLFFVGLWLASDDDGYFRTDPGRLGAELLPYKNVSARERWIGSALLRLAESGHVIVLDCGLHAVVKNLSRYQIVAATRRVVRTRGEHQSECLRNADPLPIQEGTVGNGTVGNGRERNGTSIEELRALIANPDSSAPAIKAAKRALDKMGVGYE